MAGLCDIAVMGHSMAGHVGVENSRINPRQVSHHHCRVHPVTVGAQDSFLGLGAGPIVERHTPLSTTAASLEQQSQEGKHGLALLVLQGG